MPSPVAVSADVSAELSLWRDVVALRGTIERALEQRLHRDAGISVVDFDILTTLSAAEGGQLRARALGESLGWEKSRLSHQVSRMVTRGLVTRQDCPTDLRGTWIVISDHGRAAAAKGSPGHADVLSAHFGSLDVDARAALETAIRRVIASSDAPSCEAIDDSADCRPL